MFGLEGHGTPCPFILPAQDGLRREAFDHKVRFIPASTVWLFSFAGKETMDATISV